MTDPRLIALSSNPGQVEPGPFSEHDLREQWNAQADPSDPWDELDPCEQLAWAQTRAIAAIAHAIPVAWCRSDDFNDAAQKRQSFSGWREQHSDCDMALYAHPQAGPAQSTGSSLEEVGPLIAWLAEAAVQSANAGASKNAGMLTWAAQVVGQRVDEDAPDADQAEGPNLADVDEFCKEFGFHYADGETWVLGYDDTLAVLRAMIAAAISRWRRWSALTMTGRSSPPSSRPSRG